MNKFLGIGRLVRDTELRYSQGGVGICTFTLAIDRKRKNAQGEKETDFINVKVLGKPAEFAANNAAKGKRVLVEGELHINNYEKDGERKQYVEVLADNIQIIDWPEKASQYGQEVDIPDGENPF